MKIIANTVFIIACIFAACAVFLFPSKHALNNQSVFENWPQNYEGQSLTLLPLSAKEQQFSKGFPGKIGRFSDGRREIIMRQVSESTRKLHPASDCFKAIGYHIKPIAIEQNKQGVNMGCFLASKQSSILHVCEYITNHSKTKSWSDVSSWYWDVFFNKDDSLWWSYVIAQNYEEE